MKIAILGTGVVGQTLAGKLVSLGHEVYMGTRDVDRKISSEEPGSYGRPSFKEWYSKNSKVKVVELDEAASNGEIILNATTGQGSLDALKMAGADNLRGKLLIDIANPLDFSHGMPPSLSICNTDSLGETIQRTFPEAKVVKSLNTMTASLMVDPPSVPGNHNVFICGNDEQAKTEAKKFLNSLGWKEDRIIDAGDITASRGLEMLLPLWVTLMGRFQSPMFNFAIVK